MGAKISEDELNSVLTATLPKQEKKDPKKRWVERMVKSAKLYHKICPYYDKKTTNCFIKQLYMYKRSRCDRDGRFEGCPVFVEFLERTYDRLKSEGTPLPMDFRDLPMVF